MAKIGVHFPQAEIPASSTAIRDFAQMAEELGFSHINVPDHVLQTRTPRAAFPAAANYTTEFPHHEVFTLLAFMAAVTQSIRLKTAVLILPQRQTVLVAKQAAELDLLSDGRLELGVGLGWNDPEYTALGTKFTDRGRRLVEQVEVCRALWTEQHVTFEGADHRIEDAGVAPMPIQRPIPVWIGAFAKPAIARAARIGDGWQAMLPAPDDQARKVFSGFFEDVEKAGRDPATVGLEATIRPAGHDVDQWLKEAQAWLDAGATQLMVRPGGDYPTIESAIRRFAEAMPSTG